MCTSYIDGTHSRLTLLFSRLTIQGLWLTKTRSSDHRKLIIFNLEVITVNLEWVPSIKKWNRQYKICTLFSEFFSVIFVERKHCIANQILIWKKVDFQTIFMQNSFIYKSVCERKKKFAWILHLKIGKSSVALEKNFRRQFRKISAYINLKYLQ